ncbi:5-oxoproline transporter, DUF979 family subunit [Serratia proteamaculans]|uniref:5-oxoproline transporter, DUF979 family subunit n=1 Tax=Serratia proteamaculans TaxID=28151 RepID=UPI000A157584|nr:DUF979 family protein [Serratia proteamaculans]
MTRNLPLILLLPLAVMSFRDRANPRRVTTGLFWALYGLVFLVGDWTYSLLDSIGWAFILPQILATLGLLFTTAGVGTAISHLTQEYLAVDNRFIAVAVYAIGMALLTMIMGNAFAAFPIVTAGIGIPILVLQHGGNPAVMAAIGMFSGYCGTLMTPMAANFNIVPAALLELPDKNAVIKAQIPTGVLLLLVNVFLLYFLMFL